MYIYITATTCDLEISKDRENSDGNMTIVFCFSSTEKGSQKEKEN